MANYRVARELIGIGLGLLLVVAACSGSGAGQSGEEPIRIGGTLGLTGDFSEPSTEYKAVYDDWERKINDQGGLLGRPVEMTIYDDESTPSTAQSLYQRLLNEDQVDLLLAPYTTFVGGPILPLVESRQKVLFNGGFVGIELFEKSDWMFGTYTYQEPDYPRGIFEMIDSLPAAQRPERIGIATNQNPFTLVARDGYQGQGGVKGFAEERGMEIVFDEEYAPDTSDFSGIIQGAKAADVDLFFALTLPNDGALMAEAAQELDFKPDVYCSCGSQVTTLPFWKDLADAGEGVMATTMAWPTDGYEGIKGLARLFKEQGSSEIPAYGTVALSSLQVLQQAVEGAGTLDQEKIREYLLNNEFQTANGTISFNDNGTPGYNAAVVQFVDGHNEVVWPSERATAEPQIPMR